MANLSHNSRLVSLATVLDKNVVKFNPALDQRLRLASQLAITVSELFSGGWMHKSLNNDNVVFPFCYEPSDKAPLQGFNDISALLLAGSTIAVKTSKHKQLTKV